MLPHDRRPSGGPHKPHQSITHDHGPSQKPQKAYQRIIDDHVPSQKPHSTSWYINQKRYALEEIKTFALIKCAFN
jgi:hypothetical protein